MGTIRALEWSCIGPHKPRPKTEGEVLEEKASLKCQGPFLLLFCKSGMAPESHSDLLCLPLQPNRHDVPPPEPEHDPGAATELL